MSAEGNQDYGRERWTINYAELPGESPRKNRDQDPYLNQFRLLRQQQRDLFRKIALLNLLFLLAVIACVWLGGRWVLAKYPPPDSIETPPNFGIRR
jgi:hypothetical protein